MTDILDLSREIAGIYESRARGRYGLEDISQLEHALQSAAFAEADGEPPALVLAALLHDVGHMIHKLGENPAAEGTDDRHEILGAKWLKARLPEAVSEPVRLHVEAKRYLCAAEPGYEDSLAPDSVLSLRLQGGPMNAAEAALFLARPYARDAVRLRLLDDRAKVKGAVTPPLEHFLRLLPAAAIGSAERDTFARHGFLVLRGFFSAAEAARLRGFSGAMGAEAASVLADAHARGISPAAVAASDPGGLIPVPEAADATQLCRFEYLQGHDAAFADFVGKRIMPAIDALCGEAFVPFKDKENEKHPGGGGFGPHQDFAAYGAFGPRYNVTAMVTVDPATRTNGCVEFATNFAEVAAAMPDAVEERVGGRALLAWQRGGPFHGDIRGDIAAELDWLPVETAPGDLVIFDSFAPHRSAANASAGSRRAMFLTCNARREGDWYERYYADKRAHFDDPKFHVSTPTAFAG